MKPYEVPGVTFNTIKFSSNDKFLFLIGSDKCIYFFKIKEEDKTNSCELILE